jgi:Domain of unknown function (DUF4266)
MKLYKKNRKQHEVTLLKRLQLFVNMYRFVIGAVVVLTIFSGGCSPVKEYQKMHLNDSEMELATRKTQKFEMSFQLYREGASGANGGKTGGGCGCN